MELRAGLDYIRRLRAFGSLNYLKLHGVAFLQGFVAVATDRRIVYKNIRTVISSDESIPFRIVEPFDCSAHADALPSLDPDVSISTDDPLMRVDASK